MPSNLLPGDEQSCELASDVPPPIPTAPPTQPGEVALLPQRSIWPVPIGIITIVFSAGTLLLAFGTVMTRNGGSYMAMSASGTEGEEAMMQGMADYGPILIASGIMLVIAAGLGIASGVGLLMRKRWGVKVLFVFGVWMLLAAAAYAVGQTLMMSGMMAVSMQTGAAPGTGAPPPGMMAGVSLVMGVFLFVFGAIYPAFILVWLSMPHIKKDYRGW